MAYDQNKLLDLLGSEELLNLFNELQPEIANEIVNNSFKKAAKLLVEKIDINAEGIGLENKKGHKYLLKDSAGSSLKKEYNTMNVGTLRRKGGSFAPIFNAGATNRHTKSGRSTGSIRKTNFFTDAVEGTEQEIENLIGEDFNKLLDKLIKKRNKLSK